MSVLVCGLLLVGTAAAEAQQPPPINGVTGTIAPQSTVEKTYEGINTIAVKTMDGIHHLFHMTGRTAVHGGKAAGDDALGGLDAGSRIVVHDTVEGENKTVDAVDRVADDGLDAVEGVVTKVDQRAKTFSMRLADGSLQTFRLTEHAAIDAGKDIDGVAVGAAKVVVYFNDRTGRRVAHYFTRVS
jgi:hypothetical protein